MISYLEGHIEIIKIALDFTKVLIWPLFITGIIILFRNDIKKLIGRIKEINTPWGRLNTDDKKREIQQDIQEESKPSLKQKITSDSKKPVRITNIQRGMMFEKDTLSALQTSKLSDILNIQGEEIAIRIDKKNIIFDSFASFNHIDYIIEIKGSNQINVLERGKNQILEYMAEYSNTLLPFRRGTRDVKGILIIPDCDIIDFYGNNLAILKYDTENKCFTNEDLILSWIKDN